MKTLKLLMVFGLALYISSAAQATIQDAMEYYGAGQYEQAYNEFEQVAKRGDHLAQRNLGVMFLKGQHVEKDRVEAYAWLALAAQDDAIAETGVHNKVFSVLEEDQKARAQARSRELREQYGNDALMAAMRPTYSEEQHEFRDFRALYTHAPEFPRNSARAGREGWVEIMFTIEKDGTTSDHLAYYSSHPEFSEVAIEALRHFQFEPAELEGEPVITQGATYRFIFHLQSTTERSRGRWLDRQLNDLREDAESGDPKQQFAYGYLSSAAQSYGGKRYLSEENQQNPNDWFMKAARNGHAGAGFFLGKNALYGNACEVDHGKSRFWLVQSAEKGITDSQYLLAMELFRGGRFEKNQKQGLYWLQRASKYSIAARLRYAWVLATHPDDEYRDGKMARELWDSIEPDYHDKQRYYLTAAAIAAENGRFQRALEWQRKALADARALNLPLTGREEQLALYQQKKPLRVPL